MERFESSLNDESDSDQLELPDTEEDLDLPVLESLEQSENFAKNGLPSDDQYEDNINLKDDTVPEKSTIQSENLETSTADYSKGAGNPFNGLNESLLESEALDDDEDQADEDDDDEEEDDDDEDEESSNEPVTEGKKKLPDMDPEEEKSENFAKYGLPSDAFVPSNEEKNIKLEQENDPMKRFENLETQDPVTLEPSSGDENPVHLESDTSSSVGDEHQENPLNELNGSLLESSALGNDELGNDELGNDELEESPEDSITERELELPVLDALEESENFGRNGLPSDTSDEDDDPVTQSNIKVTPPPIAPETSTATTTEMSLKVSPPPITKAPEKTSPRLTTELNTESTSTDYTLESTTNSPPSAGNPLSSLNEPILGSKETTSYSGTGDEFFDSDSETNFNFGYTTEATPIHDEFKYSRREKVSRPPEANRRGSGHQERTGDVPGELKEAFGLEEAEGLTEEQMSEDIEDDPFDEDYRFKLMEDALLGNGDPELRDMILNSSESYADIKKSLNDKSGKSQSSFHDDDSPSSGQVDSPSPQDRSPSFQDHSAELDAFEEDFSDDGVGESFFPSHVEETTLNIYTSLETETSAPWSSMGLSNWIPSEIGKIDGKQDYPVEDQEGDEYYDDDDEYYDYEEETTTSSSKTINPLPSSGLGEFSWPEMPNFFSGDTQDLTEAPTESTTAENSKDWARRMMGLDTATHTSFSIKFGINRDDEKDEEE